MIVIDWIRPRVKSPRTGCIWFSIICLFGLITVLIQIHIFEPSWKIDLHDPSPRSLSLAISRGQVEVAYGSQSRK